MDVHRHIELLRQRPRSLHELACQTGCVGWQFLPIERLTARHVVQRCGPTPSDLLSAAGRAALWDAGAARRICDVLARLTRVRRDEFIDRAITQFVHTLAIELLKKQLDDQADPDELDLSPVATELVRNALAGGNDRLRVRLALKRPLVGIGAPVHCFLPAAAALLETEAVIPPDADVANAIGAQVGEPF